MAYPKSSHETLPTIIPGEPPESNSNPYTFGSAVNFAPIAFRLGDLPVQQKANSNCADTRSDRRR